MNNNQQGSRRWTHFRSALQLAIQRSARKWTFEDFKECFPLYAEEDKEGATAIYNRIVEYIEASNMKDLNELFEQYDVQKNIDILHEIVDEAKDRKANGVVGMDVWREDLQPRSATAARTIPVLEKEVQRLRETLALLQEDNEKLADELQQSVNATKAANQRSIDLMDRLERVYEEWQSAPINETEEWALQTLDSLKPTSVG
ncbi:hypothetical protein AX16_006579 [Volvariella volvacea WC 439]|nr:hypothetical protein AX16_006579 [Volvariella volvacea WC 439]